MEGIINANPLASEDIVVIQALVISIGTFYGETKLNLVIKIGYHVPKRILEGDRKNLRLETDVAAVSRGPRRRRREECDGKL